MLKLTYKMTIRFGILKFEKPEFNPEKTQCSNFDFIFRQDITVPKYWIP